MCNCSETEEDKLNREINESIRREREMMKNSIKLLLLGTNDALRFICLLIEHKNKRNSHRQSQTFSYKTLGAGESGKTTFLKQLKVYSLRFVFYYC